MFDIRFATTRDLPQLLDIIQPYYSPAFRWDPETFRSEFASVETWVATHNNKVVAFVCLRDAVDAWEISVLATDQDFHGKGAMQSLLKEIIAAYNDERHLWLEVHENNLPAQKLYEKLGFRSDGHRGGYYSDGSAAKLYSFAKKAEAP